MSTGSSSTPNIPRASTGPPKNRIPAYLGLGAAAIVGYYLYTAGGDPNVAKKEMKREYTYIYTSI